MSPFELLSGISRIHKQLSAVGKAEKICQHSVAASERIALAGILVDQQAGFPWQVQRIQLVCADVGLFDQRLIILIVRRDVVHNAVHALIHELEQW